MSKEVKKLLGDWGGCSGVQTKYRSEKNCGQEGMWMESIPLELRGIGSVIKDIREINLGNWMAQ